eukprot:CAMPEP_0178912646 /NCGR_PEP_ID=MMETSP0786-20121207/10389_1 /TAXON_ID=186022 /ORGANISM="Thalassionema frauenfeldii, Strain CCMP 1798" /LENGTH=241 /DNA_ID=CAMNT_0020585273 /DNA_START=242 /DNA_END=963 /DNA_ORIENTATION=+
MKRRDSQKHEKVRKENFVLAIPSAPMQEQVGIGDSNRRIAGGKRITCEERRTSFESLFGGLADEIADARSATSSHIGTTLMLAQDDNFPIPYITVPGESRNSSLGRASVNLGDPSKRFSKRLSKISLTGGLDAMDEDLSTKRLSMISLVGSGHNDDEMSAKRLSVLSLIGQNQNSTKPSQRDSIFSLSLEDFFYNDENDYSTDSERRMSLVSVSPSQQRLSQLSSFSEFASTLENINSELA